MTETVERVGNDRNIFSILTPVYNPPREAFLDCVSSVLAQDYGRWEWCLVDDCSSAGWVGQTLHALAASDTRIKVASRTENGGISAATNDALVMASGDFAVLLDHDDQLTPDALGALNHEVWVDPTVDYVYSDEDKIHPDGWPYSRFYKPTWSPERLLCQNYCCHISAVRRSLLVNVGGFRSEYDGAQDYDMVLRVTERARTIVHVPRVLYHWRVVDGSTAADVGAKPHAVEAGRRAVADALRRRGIAGDVVPVGHGYHRVRRQLTSRPRVSIVVPTKGTVGRVWGLDMPYVVNMVDSLQMSTYDNVEVIVVHDTHTPTRTLDAVKQRSPYPVQLIDYAEPFNFSKQCNLGALASTADVVCFLNDDIEVLSPGWLETMLGFLQDDSIGLVGPLLLLDNFLIQSAGHISAPPANFGFRLAPNSGGGGGRPLDLNREVSGITGACMLMRRETFWSIGGFSLDFPLNYNDVDMCFKVLESGRRIIWTPDARLFHFESKSRETAVSESESKLIHLLWGRRMKRDPYLPETSVGSVRRSRDLHRIPRSR